MLRFPLLRCLTIPALLSLTLATGCTWVTSKDQVLFTSDPLGARLFIDGTDTGFTTPIKLPIGGTFGFDHEVRLEKKGYRPEVRQITQHTEGYTSKWIDGAWDPTMPPLPFFWTFGDLVMPFGIRAAIVPGELHVKLYREGDPLLGAAALAAKRAAAQDSGQ